MKDIFSLIFPEFNNLERLEKLSKIPINFNLGKKILLAILLIDETNNYEYFSHKYNISNNLKENLSLLSKNFINFRVNKKFFQNDLKKNIFYFGKEHLKELYLLNFLVSKKLKLNDFKIRFCYILCYLKKGHLHIFYVFKINSQNSL